MTIDDVISALHKSIGKNNDVAIHMDTAHAEQLLYWLTEYRAMTSNRQSDSLSERLAEHLVWAESNSYECPITLAEDLQEAISNINRLHSESSWIPCSEMLPDNAVRCIVCMSDGAIHFAWWDAQYYDNGEGAGAWCVLYPGKQAKMYRAKNVPYWMPIPEPPKEHK